jgi:HD-GYP domain-containing protein (c-di-GMP phosphodiesterase class II)
MAEALGELRRSAGQHHDPRVVDALVHALELRRLEVSQGLDAKAA